MAASAFNCSEADGQVSLGSTGEQRRGQRERTGCACKDGRTQIREFEESPGMRKTNPEDAANATRSQRGTVRDPDGANTKRRYSLHCATVVRPDASEYLSHRRRTHGGPDGEQVRTHLRRQTMSRVGLVGRTRVRT